MQENREGRFDPGPSIIRSTTFKWGALGAILVLYMGLSFYQVNLPGLHYDEAFEVVPALQLLLGRPVTAFRNSGLVIDGRLFPLMTQDYIGAINTYLSLPFIYVMGPTPAALRTMSILVGLLTLMLTYALTHRLTGSARAGLAATLILAVDPTFVFWNRQGVFVTAVTAAIGLAAALSWLRALQQGSFPWAAAGALLFGMGLYAKFLFLWLIVALVGAATLFYLLMPGVRLASLLIAGRRMKWIVSLPLLILAFTVGAWPLIVYNIQTGGTFLNFSHNATTSYYGVNNLAFGPNLITRLGQFVAFLKGSHFWYLGAIASNSLPVLFFGLILLLVLITIFTIRIRGVDPERSRDNGFFSGAALFPFLVIGLVLLASIATISALWITHFAVLMPWPAIAMVSGAQFVLRAWDRPPNRISNALPQVRRRRPAGRVLLCAGLLMLVATQLLSVFRYHAALAESGGLGSHSDAIYRLSDWLADRSSQPVVAMDWGLAAPVTYLTNGQVTPTEVFGYGWQSDVELVDYLESFIVEPATLYLWRAPDEIIFDRSGEFKALYRPLGLEENIEEAFYERSGRPILGVTQLVEQGTADNPPQ